MKNCISNEIPYFKYCARASIVCVSLAAPAYGDSIEHVAQEDARFLDLSLAGSALSAKKGDLLCFYRYQTEPFALNEEECINGDGYELRSSRWKSDGDMLVVSRFRDGNVNESLAVYSIDPQTNRYALSWESGRLINETPQVNSLEIIDWVTDNAVLFSRSCGSSCSALAIMTTEGALSEPVYVSTDYRYDWDTTRKSMNGVERSGKLFRVDVVVDSVNPKLAYTEYFSGCLGAGRADEPRFWFKFEDILDDSTTYLSRHVCASGLTFNFAEAPIIVVDENFEVIDENALGSPLSISHDTRRVASITLKGGEYFLEISNSANFTAIHQVLLPGFKPEESSVDSDYDWYTPQWSPNDEYVLVPKSPLTGGAIVVSVVDREPQLLDSGDSTGGRGFSWIGDNTYVAVNLGEMNFYEILRSEAR